MENRRIEQEKNKEAAIEEIATETGKPVEQTRIALIGIIVEDLDSVERMNSILHEAGECGSGCPGRKNQWALGEIRNV